MSEWWILVFWERFRVMSGEVRAGVRDPGRVVDDKDWGDDGIGGMTGDTMGANTEVDETRVFVVRLGSGEG